MRIVGVQNAKRHFNFYCSVYVKPRKTTFCRVPRLLTAAQSSSIVEQKWECHKPNSMSSLRSLRSHDTTRTGTQNGMQAAEEMRRAEEINEGGIFIADPTKKVRVAKNLQCEFVYV